MEKHTFKYKLYPFDAPQPTDIIDPSIEIGQTEVTDPDPETGEVIVTVTKTVPNGYTCQSQYACPGSHCSAFWDQPCTKCDDCIPLIYIQEDAL